jgi:hypothetical protein
VSIDYPAFGDPGDNDRVKRVSVFMDVEDPVNPLADDAALDFPPLFANAGVRGSFCITGEKCRTLKARGRFDVVEAYRPHCLGLHTDTHSNHPTTMELLAEVPFDEGCIAAFKAEQRGLEPFVDLFARKPAFWGGAGNTWSPEITDALKRLGMHAYVYALTALPDQAVHRFNGVVALPQALSVSEDDWADDDRAEAASKRVLAALDTIPQPWIGIFVGHPTRFRHAEFWDVPFSNGRTPPRPEQTQAVADETYARAKRNLQTFLTALARRVSVVGVDEVLRLPWEFRSLDDAEGAYFREWTPKNIRIAANWPIHCPALDPEGIILKTLALEDTVEIGFIP